MKMSEKTRIRLQIMRNAPLDSSLALSHDETRMVAASRDFGEAGELSKAAGEDNPILVKTPVIWGEYEYFFQELDR